MGDAAVLARNLFIRTSHDELNEWPIVMHPAVFILVVTVYLCVLTLGPKLMKNRRPFELRLPMIIYNTIQMAFNSWLLFKYFNILGFYQGLTFFSNICSPILMNDPNNIFIAKEATFGVLQYYTNKILDLTETVFFVLRKKDSQISTLHVFHHLSMVVSVYLCVTFAPEEISVTLGMINSSVHLVMYVYYFLAGFGPAIQKYLWWKKYITKLQMMQFGMILTILFKMILDGCQVSPLFWFVWVFNVSTFFVLFYQFYSQAYKKAK